MKSVLLSSIIVFAMAGSANAGEKAKKNPLAIFETSMGNIIIELYQDKAPVTVSNFLSYVDSGFYSGTIFHRVIDRFMIQGGGFTPDMQQKATMKPIQNEADNGVKNERGTIAMARTQQPHSASSQFFINTVDNHFLDHQRKDFKGWGYAVFGRVTEGMDVVDAISKVKTGAKSMFRDVPVTPIIINKVSVKK